jgi:type II secretory ATPase GspE/PulE/Tfp pilus assembly ATPase PilB-like protein
MHSLEDIRRLIEEVLQMKKAYRISRILEVMLSGAIFVGSSDVHLEPEEEMVRLRYRLDGVLTDVVEFDRDTYRLMLSRIKLISGLKLNVKSSAQDGRFSISVDDKDTEVRTSIIPDAYGESIVMRLLNPDNIELKLQDLGMEDKLLDTLLREIKKPNGLIVTTGPTGSGKTTTLYAFMRTIHNPDIKIITIEDPVEYHLSGIVQTQIDGTKYTFSSGLRAALRQDPDVIMVGEIRDAEVAETAIHSALTGHLVFSTLHTNNAAGAIPRLIGLAIDPKIIGSSVNVIMAQRLVRKLCKNCNEELPITDAQTATMRMILDHMAEKGIVEEMPKTLWSPKDKGCEECNHLGYKGRIGIYEAILIDEKMADLVTMNPSEHEIMREASRQGLLTMRQDGIMKVLHGITSLEEVGRVVSLEDDSGGKLNEDNSAADDVIQKALDD